MLPLVALFNGASGSNLFHKFGGNIKDGRISIDEKFTGSRGSFRA